MVQSFYLYIWLRCQKYFFEPRLKIGCWFLNLWFLFLRFLCCSHLSQMRCFTAWGYVIIGLKADCALGAGRCFSSFLILYAPTFNRKKVFDFTNPLTGILSTLYLHRSTEGIPSTPFRCLLNFWYSSDDRRLTYSARITIFLETMTIAVLRWILTLQLLDEDIFHSVFSQR